MTGHDTSSSVSRRPQETAADHSVIDFFWVSSTQWPPATRWFRELLSTFHSKSTCFAQSFSDAEILSVNNEPKWPRLEEIVDIKDLIIALNLTWNVAIPGRSKNRFWLLQCSSQQLLRFVTAKWKLSGCVSFTVSRYWWEMNDKITNAIDNSQSYWLAAFVAQGYKGPGISGILTMSWLVETESSFTHQLTGRAWRPETFDKVCVLCQTGFVFAGEPFTWI